MCLFGRHSRRIQGGNARFGPMRPLIFTTALIMSVAASAAPLSMKLAPELAGLKPLAVSGKVPDLWKGEMQYGPWQSTSPVPLATRTWTWEALLPDTDDQTHVEAPRTAFQFELRDGDPAVAVGVQCLARGSFGVRTEERGRVTDETVVTLPGYPRLDCKFAGLDQEPGGEVGQLSLRPAFLTQRDSGLARFGERLWNIQSVNNLATQRSSFPLGRFGYEIRRSGALVAAVEVAGKGRVWFVPELAEDERRELALTVAALLHYGVLLEKMDL